MDSDACNTSLDGWVNSALESGASRDDVISALELKLMALREEEEEVSNG